MYACVPGNGGYASAPATPLPALRRELYAADALRPPEGCRGSENWPGGNGRDLGSRGVNTTKHNLYIHTHTRTHTHIYIIQNIILISFDMMNDRCIFDICMVYLGS